MVVVRPFSWRHKLLGNVHSYLLIDMVLCFGRVGNFPNEISRQTEKNFSCRVSCSCGETRETLTLFVVITRSLLLFIFNCDLLYADYVTNNKLLLRVISFYKQSRYLHIFVGTQPVVKCKDREATCVTFTSFKWVTQPYRNTSIIGGINIVLKHNLP